MTTNCKGNNGDNKFYCFKLKQHKLTHFCLEILPVATVVSDRGAVTDHVVGNLDLLGQVRLQMVDVRLASQARLQMVGVRLVAAPANPGNPGRTRDLAASGLAVHHPSAVEHHRHLCTHAHVYNTATLSLAGSGIKEQAQTVRWSIKKV